MAEEIKLSKADVARLLQDPSTGMRAGTAAKVATEFSVGNLSAEERTLAEEIFRLMLRDAEVRVRQALSEKLKESPMVPRDVAIGLAGDVAEVAAPMLESSSVLTDADLLEIVRSHPADHQIAIAKRATVSEAVSDALAESRNEDVVATLMGNDGADIAERTLQKVIDDFGDSEKVNAPMAHRAELPVSISERLVSLVSDTLKDHLVTHHEMSSDTATDLILQSRERATLSLLGRKGEFKDSMQLVNQLHRNGRLTSTIILRSLCLGDLDFFEAAIAKLGNIPVSSAHRLIFDRSGLGLEAIYRRCGLPQGLYKFVRTALDVVHETNYDGGPADRERFRSRVIERVLTSFEEGFDRDSFDYLINKLNYDAAHAA